VRINRQVVESILGYMKGLHPKEGILLLKGRVRKNEILINEVELPPFAVHGHGFSRFPWNMLPIDFSIVGTAHSHPSGSINPSIVDLNHLYGRIMVIAAYPYDSEKRIALFNGAGKRIVYEIIDYSEN